jgi:MFS family permease
MYLPSLLSGWLIGRFGTARIMLAGCLALLAVVWIGSQGTTVQHYWVALVLLGIGWNFMFISGTTLLPTVYGDGEPFRVQALNEAVVFGSQAIASLSAGWVLWSLGWNTLLYSCVPIIVAHLLLLAYWRFVVINPPA